MYSKSWLDALADIHNMASVFVLRLEIILCFSLIIVVTVLLISLSGCSGMSTRDKNTAIGAGVGAAAGAVLTGGSAVGTVGGAAVGGIIGHQIGK